ncbi:MAG: SpoIIE family protein phosphatase [Chlorobi bacterium]|nr:SpoIIE family protein phosphatase [Chlorobiota bacterium]
MSKIKVYILFYVILFFALEFLVYQFLINQSNHNLEHYLAQKLNETKNYYNSFLTSFEKYSNNIFENIINTPEKINIVEKSENSFHLNTKLTNNLLNESFSSTYNAIRFKNILIFNFYDTDGKLFLKFNKSENVNPELYKKRYSIKRVNQDKQFLQGIEEGPDFIAYRFVYPIYNKHKFIGSVELGVPLFGLINEMNALYAGKIVAFVKKDIIPVNLLKDSLFADFFIPSEFNNYYFYNRKAPSLKVENNRTNNFVKDSIYSKINRVIASQTNNLTKSNKIINRFILIDTVSFLTTYLPVSNIKGEQKIYFAFYEKDNFLKNSRNIFYQTFGAGSLFLLFMVFLVYYFNRSRIKALKQKNTIKLQAEKLEKINARLFDSREEMLLQNEELISQADELESKKELLTAINKELEKMSIIASESNNLIYLFDENGKLDWFNESFYHKIGINTLEYKDLFGKTIFELSQNENIKEYFEESVKYKKSVTYESSMTLSENKKLWFFTTLTPIFYDNGNLKMIVAIDSDITELKKAEQELERQHKLTIHQRDEILYQKKELTDSIIYAKRIQEAILTRPSQIKKVLNDSFVIYSAKDIVSGDFLWYFRKDDDHFLIAVDCTGHGVPGAFMSIIGTYLLNNIIIQNRVYDPAEILRNLNRKLKISLKSENLSSQTNDGMDVAICKFNLIEERLTFSGAIRPLFLFQNNEFIEIKGDKNPITSYIANQTKNNYTNHTYKFGAGDVFYMFSDGIIDQFGGKDGKKFLSKRLKQLLIDINMLSMDEQRKIIHSNFESWKGNNEQVDDVLLVGVRNTI